MKAFKALLGIVCGAALFSCTAPAQQEVKADEGKNAVIETIMTRRSVRKYQPQAVNRDTMQLIVECGINAPNAINRQAWEIRIVDNLEVNNPIILALGPGDFTTAGHYVVLVGVEDGKFRVNDPNSVINSQKLWSYEELEGQIRNIWVIREGK